MVMFTLSGCYGMQTILNGDASFPFKALHYWLWIAWVILTSGIMSGSPARTFINFHTGEITKQDAVPGMEEEDTIQISTSIIIAIYAIVEALSKWHEHIWNTNSFGSFILSIIIVLSIVFGSFGVCYNLLKIKLLNHLVRLAYYLSLIVFVIDLVYGIWTIIDDFRNL